MRGGRDERVASVHGGVEGKGGRVSTAWYCGRGMLGQIVRYLTVSRSNEWIGQERLTLIE